MRNSSLFLLMICALQAAPALAADHRHLPPLPIPNGTYGNIEGCLLLHGDQPEGAPLWLTPREIGGGDLHCVIESWQHDANGVLTFDCGMHKYLVYPPSVDDGWFTVAESLNRQNFSTYEVAKCAPE